MIGKSMCSFGQEILGGGRIRFPQCKVECVEGCSYYCAALTMKVSKQKKINIHN
jgi:hypothetical protein